MGSETVERVIRDFLYRDESRLGSMFAQIFKGKLTQINKAMNESSSARRQVSASAGVVSGALGADEESSSSITEIIDPHDQRIISILEELNIPVFSDKLSDTEDGKIILIKGNIKMRNFKSLSTSIPLLPEIMGMNSNSKERSKLKHDTKPMMSILKLLPLGLELEMQTEQGDIVVGSVKEDYLEDSPEDIARIYGTQLPGQWFALGIVSKRSTRELYPPQTELRASIDEMANVIQGLYALGDFFITPILIYRELSC